jgi:hypothetical protein
MVQHISKEQTEDWLHVYNSMKIINAFFNAIAVLALIWSLSVHRKRKFGKENITCTFYPGVESNSKDEEDSSALE